MESFTPRASDQTLQQQMQELMCFLWDNYLQIYEGVEEIFLMGVGTAYLGVKMLLINRGQPHGPHPAWPHSALLTSELQIANRELQG
jgi:hypothetical protein